MQQTQRASAPKPPKDTEPNIDQAVRELQSISNILNRKLRFSVNKELEQVVVKVIDTRTDKVIKELPPSEVQEMRIRIRQTIDKMFEEPA